MNSVAAKIDPSLSLERDRLNMQYKQRDASTSIVSQKNINQETTLNVKLIKDDEIGVKKDKAKFYQSRIVASNFKLAYPQPIAESVAYVPK